MIEYKVKVYKDRTEWYLNGQLHREDGPAFEGANGDKMWFQNGKYHREDGPAIEYQSGTKHWYLNGNYHREDGPAIVWADGTKFWYLNGKELTDLYFLERNKVELTLEEIADKFNIDINQLKIKK